jgi:branched-chain amino acid aminotransferase
MPGFFIFNGRQFPAGTPILGPDSRGLRYGDGLFETMRVHQGRIPLAAHHFDRCFRGMAQLGFQKQVHQTAEALEQEILALCRKNGHPQSARVRLSFFRGDGGLYDPVSAIPLYTIQTWALPDHYGRINENGLVLTVYPDDAKSTGILSNLKTNNALIYVMAARYAKEQHCNEALVLNAHGRIADATIANLFWVKDEILYTPPLAEGGVDGVMRKALLQIARDEGRAVVQSPVDRETLLDADEIFLTNSLYGIRWVGSFEGKMFPAFMSPHLYDRWIRRIFPSP